MVPNISSKHCGNHSQSLASKRKPEGSKSVQDDAAKLANLEEQPTNSIIFGQLYEDKSNTHNLLLTLTKRSPRTFVWAHRWSICFPYQLRLSHSRLHARSSLPPDFGLFRRYFAKKRWSKFVYSRSNTRVFDKQVWHKSFVKKLRGMGWNGFLGRIRLGNAALDK